MGIKYSYTQRGNIKYHTVSLEVDLFIHGPTIPYRFHMYSLVTMKSEVRKRSHYLKASNSCKKKERKKERKKENNNKQIWQLLRKYWLILSSAEITIDTSWKVIDKRDSLRIKVDIVRNEIGDPISNPGWDCVNFISCWCLWETY